MKQDGVEKGDSCCKGVWSTFSRWSEPSRKLRRFWFMGESRVSGPVGLLIFIIFIYFINFIFGSVGLDELGQGMEER